MATIQTHRLVTLVLFCSLLLLARASEISLPNPQRWPSVACTPEELARLQQAYRGSGPEHDVVARRVEQANEAFLEDVAFPPEGGQHNQWYQCDQCQLGLQTVDATHHRCPKCGQVYSGYPYDHVIYSRTHNRLTRNLWLCAWAYALTEDPHYARRLGIDLYSVPGVKDMFTVALDYRMADGTLPRFGDATTTRIPGQRYEAAFHHWRDPALLSLLPDRPTWDSVMFGRTEKPGQASTPTAGSLKLGAGHALLRAGSATAAFTFGPFGGFHGHFDAVIYPTKGGGPDEVEGVECLDHPAGGWLIRIRLRDGADELYAYDPSASRRTVEGVETGSKLLCLRREHGKACQVLAETDP
jgi:hypothetical protein